MDECNSYFKIYELIRKVCLLSHGYLFPLFFWYLKHYSALSHGYKEIVKHHLLQWRKRWRIRVHLLKNWDLSSSPEELEIRNGKEIYVHVKGKYIFGFLPVWAVFLKKVTKMTIFFKNAGCSHNAHMCYLYW